MDFAHLVHGAGVKENALSRRGLPGIDVCGDADVAGPFQREWTFLGIHRGDFRLIGDNRDVDGSGSGHEQEAERTVYQRRWAKARLA